VRCPETLTDRPRIIQVVGTSGSGKTLVVERCVRELKSRGLSVAVVKHSHHSPDLQGKDTARYAEAGADAVLFASRESFLRFQGAPASLVCLLPFDVVLVEGYSRRRFGGFRFRINRPSEAPRLAKRILGRTPRERSRPAIELDGRQQPADRLWWLVLNVMAERQVRTVRRP
jgi:molybdopterin-guanine dinucleotide biosynthesis adapter protein